MWPLDNVEFPRHWADPSNPASAIHFKAAAKRSVPPPAVGHWRAGAGLGRPILKCRFREAANLRPLRCARVGAGQFGYNSAINGFFRLVRTSVPDGLSARLLSPSLQCADAPAALPAFGKEMLLGIEKSIRVFPARPQSTHNIAAIAAITAVGTPIFDILLSSHGGNSRHHTATRSRNRIIDFGRVRNFMTGVPVFS